MSLSLLVIVTLVSSAIGTISGFGISTIMVPIVLIFLPLPETLLLVAAIHLFGDFWKMLLFKKGFDKNLMIKIGFSGIIFSIIGAFIVLRIPAQISSFIIGTLILEYIIFLKFYPLFHLRKDTLSVFIAGGLSGLFSGLTGVGGGALRAMMVSAFAVSKETHLFTLGFFGALVDSARIMTYLGSGVRFSGVTFFQFIILIVASFFGAEIGKKVIDKIPAKSFRGVILFFLAFLGLKLVFFP